MPFGKCGPYPIIQKGLVQNSPKMSPMTVRPLNLIKSVRLAGSPVLSTTQSNLPTYTLLISLTVPKNIAYLLNNTSSWNSDLQDCWAVDGDLSKSINMTSYSWLAVDFRQTVHVDTVRIHIKRGKIQIDSYIHTFIHTYIRHPTSCNLYHSIYGRQV